MGTDVPAGFVLVETKPTPFHSSTLFMLCLDSPYDAPALLDCMTLQLRVQVVQHAIACRRRAEPEGGGGGADLRVYARFAKQVTVTDRRHWMAVAGDTCRVYLAARKPGITKPADIVEHVVCAGWTLTTNMPGLIAVQMLHDSPQWDAFQHNNAAIVPSLHLCLAGLASPAEPRRRRVKRPRSPLTAAADDVQGTPKAENSEGSDDDHDDHDDHDQSGAEHEDVLAEIMASDDHESLTSLSTAGAAAPKPNPTAPTHHVNTIITRQLAQRLVPNRELEAPKKMRTASTGAARVLLPPDQFHESLDSAALRDVLCIADEHMLPADVTALRLQPLYCGLINFNTGKVEACKPSPDQRWMLVPLSVADECKLYSELADSLGCVLYRLAADALAPSTRLSRDPEPTRPSNTMMADGSDLRHLRTRATSMLLVFDIHRRRIVATAQGLLLLHKRREDSLLNVYVACVPLARPASQVQAVLTQVHALCEGVCPQRS